MDASGPMVRRAGIHPFIYRVAMKLLNLQKLCCLDVVLVRHITAAVQSVQRVKQDVRLNRQEVTQTLDMMFLSVLQEVPGHVTKQAPEETCNLVFRLYHPENARCPSALVSSVSLLTALIALSADKPAHKYTALVQVAEDSLGCISRIGLRCLLQDLSQLPVAVQEGGVFLNVEAAVTSCFYKVTTPTADERQVLSWLQSEPCLLLWLPTLYYLSVSKNLCHNVRCHTCKTLPITGLRFRCMNCVNVHLCQSCFLLDRHTKKHKSHHTLLELHTQPSVGESCSSLLRRARNFLLPGRPAARERGGLMWEESEERQNRAPPPPSPPSAATFDADVSHDASVLSPSCSLSSKSLQTDDETPTQQGASALLSDVRDLQRDKWLLEQQLNSWKLTVQSEHGILEDRCAEMEVTVETLRETNLHLQGMLMEVLNKMEAQQPTWEERETRRETEGIKDKENDAKEGEEEEQQEGMEEEQQMGLEEEQQVKEHQTLSPIMHHDTPVLHDPHCEELEPPGMFLCRLMGQQHRSGEAEPQGEEDCGVCSLEELLRETVDGLRTLIQTNRCAVQKQTGERRGAQLLEAADQVGESIGYLVDSIRMH